jgi:hypothetical protein
MARPTSVIYKKEYLDTSLTKYACMYLLPPRSKTNRYLSQDFPRECKKYGVSFYIVHVHLRDPDEPSSSLLHTCFSLYLDVAILQFHLLRFCIFRLCMYRSISSHLPPPWLSSSFGLLILTFASYLEIRFHFPPPLGPSMLGTAFRPTLFPAGSALGTPWMVRGSFIRLTSSWAGTLETIAL